MPVPTIPQGKENSMPQSETTENHPLLTASALAKRFGPTMALRGVDVDVRSGRVLAIMGPSGSGKSTLLHCLAGILSPDSGEVLFKGRRLDGMNERERSELRSGSFGFVFQFGQLIPELPAVENVMLPLLLSRVRRDEAADRAMDHLAELDVAEVAHRLPGDMSGGQVQRVAIARALVTEPAIIFADEPTGSLDSKTSDVVMDQLLIAARQRGTAVVIVTHESTVAAYADDEMVIRDGTAVSNYLATT